jgi:DNA-binding response OmpR family regulator
VDVQRLQLLVVAADPEVIKSVRGILTEARVGADLLHAEDPERALEFLHPRDPLGPADGPDLVLLDTDVGSDQVTAVLDPIAADDDLVRLPVVAVSSHADTVANDIGDHRIHEIITKPPTADELLRVLSYFDEA